MESQFKFRFICSNFEESMGTCAEMDSLEDLKKLVTVVYGLVDPDLEFTFNGHDPRNDWQTYYVYSVKSGSIMGIASDMPTGAQWKRSRNDL